jgi:amino acid adenylation domain-containing protein
MKKAKDIEKVTTEMSDFSQNTVKLPPAQEVIRAKCFHPTGTFVEFKKEQIEQSIPERFDEQARKYPGRTAVITRSHTLTYDQLNQVANRLAGAILNQRGTEQEPIALLLEHSASAIAAILGTLKAGKIYVPLDTTYPQSRIGYILEDSEAAMIVTNNRNFSLALELAKNKRQQLLNIDELDANSSIEQPDLYRSPDSLAWILYTSGSTGQPKGVVQTHRNVLHDIMNYTNAFHICKDDRLILLTSYSVVDTVRTMYGALLNGASLYPFGVKEEGLTHLAEWLIRHEITIYRSFSTLFRHFINNFDGEQQFPRLRLLYLAGEPVYRRDVELYKRYFSPDCIFVNGIGSTECLTYRWYLVNKETQINNNNVPVGYPLEDMEVLLLDDGGNEVAFNQIGEMSIRSRYLSAGYWRRPELSEAKFLRDPNGGDERIYRTGDLGVMLDDGCLVHMGRKDFQVKVRGYRIEVGEIEAALLNLDNVKEAVAILREDRSGDKRLVAYIVPFRQPAPTIMTLRNALAENLPDYMVPSAFVVLDTLPLLPNGKLDRQGLPGPDNSRPKLDTPYVVPETTVEQTLAKIWAEVLNIDQVGIHDNFFDLGGHSLAATRVVSQVIKHFQVELPLRSLFQSPTVAAMATVIAEHRGKNMSNEEVENILTKLESLTDEEIQRILSERVKYSK